MAKVIITIIIIISTTSISVTTTITTNIISIDGIVNTMPLIELATVRLQPSQPIPPPPSFTQTWTQALHAVSSAAGIPFQLYRSTTDAAVYMLIGAWRTGAEHVAFLSTPAAVDLARAIGQFMTVDIVRHIAGDIAPLEDPRPERLRVAVYKVPEALVKKWEDDNSHTPRGVGGWDESASVQKHHQAFRKMGDVTNSASAFGRTDGTGTVRDWVWIEPAREEYQPRNTSPEKDMESETWEIEYVIG